MRHLMSIVLVGCVALGPATPVLADAGVPIVPMQDTQSQRGDAIPLPQMQAGQVQDQQHLQQRVVLDNSRRRQAASPHIFIDHILPVEVTFDAAPEHDRQIGVNDPFHAAWVFTNTGTMAHLVTLLTVITPVGTTDSKEFYTKDQRVPVGGATLPVTISQAQLAEAGIRAGEHQVAFVALDAFGNRLGGETAGFFGHPLAIGTAAPAFATAPTYTATLAADAPFTATYTLTNTGDAPAAVTVTTVLTPLGNPDPTAVRELAQAARLAPGTSTVTQTLSAADRTAQGITPGQYTVSFLVLDAAGRRLGPGFAGNPLAIGTAAPAFATAPTYTATLAPTEDFTARFVLQNPGTAPSRVTLLTVITPVGTTNSQEFYRDATLPVGGGALPVTITNQALAARGIVPGQYLVTFVVYDAFGNRLGGPTFGYFGNPWSFGTAQLAFPERPTFTPTVPPDQDFVATFNVSHTGDTVANGVVLLAAFTPVRTTNTIEAVKKVTVPLRGGLLDFRLTMLERALLNLSPGVYTVTFLVFDPFGRKIGDGFFGSAVELT